MAFAIRSGSLNDGQMAMVMTIKAILDEEYQFEPRHCHGQGGTAASSAEFGGSGVLLVYREFDGSTD